MNVKLNAKRKAPGRRGAGDVVNLEVDKVINTHSAVLARVVAEVNKGHSVMISPRHLPTGGKIHGATDALDPSTREYRGGHFNMSFTDVATMLAGGAALGMTSLAVAPASLVVAGLAVVVGAALSAIAAKKLDAPES
jgi:hypothetical protein